MNLFGDIAAGITGAANSIYNMFTNKRDFDYQKALQQQMFEREDTAVQRRMADLQAAGINPNLAAGNAAGAGSVVSRSNTNDVNMGSALDMIQAVNNIRQQRQQTENAKVENQILENQRAKLYLDKQISLAQTMYQLGLPVGVETFKNKDRWNFKVFLDDSDNGRFTWNTEKPLINTLDYQLNSLKNSSDLLQKDVDFYTSDKVASYLMPLLRLLK